MASKSHTVSIDKSYQDVESTLDALTKACDAGDKVFQELVNKDEGGPAAAKLRLIIDKSRAAINAVQNIKKRLESGGLSSDSAVNQGKNLPEESPKEKECADETSRPSRKVPKPWTEEDESLDQLHDTYRRLLELPESLNEYAEERVREVQEGERTDHAPAFDTFMDDQEAPPAVKSERHDANEDEDEEE
tara:strand:- start:60898 stop:61467 length:570 start_codon:yes stop_codon:yes gene_type:complete